MISETEEIIANFITYIMWAAIVASGLYLMYTGIAEYYPGLARAVVGAVVVAIACMRARRAARRLEDDDAS